MSSSISCSLISSFTLAIFHSLFYLPQYREEKPKTNYLSAKKENTLFYLAQFCDYIFFTLKLHFLSHSYSTFFSHLFSLFFYISFLSLLFLFFFLIFLLFRNIFPSHCIYFSMFYVKRKQRGRNGERERDTKRSTHRTWHSKSGLGFCGKIFLSPRIQLALMSVFSSILFCTTQKAKDA